MGSWTPVARDKIACTIQLTQLDAVHLYVTSDDFDERYAMVALTPAEARSLAYALLDTAQSVEECE